MPDVLLVMRRPSNFKVVSAVLREHGYSVSGVRDRDGLEGRLAKPPLPDAALVDVSDFRDEVGSLCDRLQRANVIFFVISSRSGAASDARQRAVGAHGVLEKPVAKDSLVLMLDEVTRR